LTGGRKPRQRRQTWRERAKEITSGFGLLTVALLAVPVLVISMVAFYLGINYLAELIARWAMGKSIVRTLVGVTLVVLAALGWFQVIPPQVTARGDPSAVLYWAVFSLFMIGFGVALLTADFTDGSQTTGF
jgi:uncharacterized BrkB/YihY/UPF0761 family membrane protein